LFAPHFSAIDSLQECSQLFEVLKAGTAFAGEVVGRHLHTHPYFASCCTSPILLLYWQVNCVNFIPSSEWSLALFLLVACPTLSAFNSLQECSQLFEELKVGTAFAG
jgi:hypothetical protein